MLLYKVYDWFMVYLLKVLRFLGWGFGNFCMELVYMYISGVFIEFGDIQGLERFCFGVFWFLFYSVNFK